MSRSKIIGCAYDSTDYGLLRAWILVACLACTLCGHASESARSKLVLTPRPTRVFKTPDRGRENTESWIFSLMIQINAPAQVVPLEMKATLLRDSKVLSTTSYHGDGFKSLTFKPASPPSHADGSPSPTPIYWPFAVRIRGREPQSAGANALRLEVEAREQNGRRRRGEILVPLETYQQKTSLIFPFRGRGIILQGGASNGGHRNRSGLFALDACGLDDSWSIQAPGEGKLNSDYRGWGRELVAPADGVVVRTRTDRPDQPVPETSDSNYYAPEYKVGGDPGNYLVIDHGASEFSMIAHFQAGSMLVKLGEHVQQGQPLGKLGNSGDTTGPHCHFQLQSGPDWENADGFPCKFNNVEQTFLDRGTYFEAKTSR